MQQVFVRKGSLTRVNAPEKNKLLSLRFVYYETSDGGYSVVMTSTETLAWVYNIFQQQQMDS